VIVGLIRSRLDWQDRRLFGQLPPVCWKLKYLFELTSPIRDAMGNTMMLPVYQRGIGIAPDSARSQLRSDILHNNRKTKSVNGR